MAAITFQRFADAQLIARVCKPFASKDDYRPLLTCLHFVDYNDKLGVSAIDSYKALDARFVNVNVDKGTSICVPAAWFAASLKLFTHRASPVVLRWDDRHIALSCGPHGTETERVEGQFPNVSDLVQGEINRIDTADWDMTVASGALALHQLRALHSLPDDANTTIRRSEPTRATVFDIQHGAFNATALVMPIRRS